MFIIKNVGQKVKYRKINQIYNEKIFVVREMVAQLLTVLKFCSCCKKLDDQARPGPPKNRGLLSSAPSYRSKSDE